MVRRRLERRLGVSRRPHIEPLGSKREEFYQLKLLAGLAWHCPERPVQHADGKTVWHFRWEPPPPAEFQGGVVLDPIDLYLGGDEEVSFEALCHELDDRFCRFEYGLLCSCCALANGPDKCASCKYAIGFHYCTHENRDTDKLRWCKGTLFADTLDVQRCLYNMSKKGVPTHALRTKADEYVQHGHITAQMADSIMRVIEDERGANRLANDVDVGDGAPDPTNAAEEQRTVVRMNREQLAAELKDRETKLQAGAPDGQETDQWRVYQYIIAELSSDRPLRLMVQASAGTGDCGFYHPSSLERPLKPHTL